MAGEKHALVANSLLAALPCNYHRTLKDVLEPVELEFGDVLHEPQAEIRHVYFPNDSFVSLLTAVDSGQAIEVGLIGREGIIGGQIALGAGISHYRAMVQGAGIAMRMATADFRRCIGHNTTLKDEVLFFTNLLTAQIAQTGACNRYHVITQRMARWLLMSRDRTNFNELRISQKFLALMLGVRRVGVSAAMSTLRDHKLIAYRHGTITILDHQGLEEAACGCYRTVKKFYDQRRF